MKLIIAGSRSVDKYRAFYEFTKWAMINMLVLNEVEELVTGCCYRGADQVPFLLNIVAPTLEAERVITKFPADWDTYGKSAGFKRNTAMAEYADELLLIWDGVSKGSAHMKSEMIARDKPVYEVIV